MSNDSLISMGMIGWIRKSTEPHYDNGTKDNDGNTLYRVQLFAGADSELLSPEQQKDGTARGHKVICQMSSHIRRIPPVGTKVLVAFPNGYTESAGSGVIIATLEPNPTAVSDKAVTVTENRVSIDYGPDADIVISGRSVTIRSYDNDYVSVGGSQGTGIDGVAIQSMEGTGATYGPNGATIFTAKDGAGYCVLALDKDSIKLATPGGGGYIDLNADGFYALGKKCTVQGGHVYLGRTPTALAPACYAVGGTTVSPSVFVSPV